MSCANRAIFYNTVQVDSRCVRLECGREDSNLHPRKDQDLNLARMPISPRPRSAILEEIGNALARGDRVEIRGFGAFSTKQRDARVGRNPRTGVHVPVEEKMVPVFRAGKEMRERINRSRNG